MRRQGMRRHNASSGVNASSGGNASSGNVSSQRVVRGAGDIANVSSQCVVSVSAKCHTQAAGAPAEISSECTLSAAIHSQHIVAKHCSSWKFFFPDA